MQRYKNAFDISFISGFLSCKIVNYKMLSFPLLLSFFVLILDKSVLGQRQQVTLYDRANCAGYYLAVTEDDIPRLSVYNFNDRAYSVKITGTWIFYEAENYGAAGTEYFFHRSGGCFNLKEFTARKVSSIRYAGQPNWSSSSINLYEGTFFVGHETQSTKDIPVLKTAQRSLIVTGAEEWSVFENPWFGGRATCVKPNRNNEPFIDPDIAKNLPYAIQSVKRGCKA